jgi:hypothetical protein
LAVFANTNKPLGNHVIAMFYSIDEKAVSRVSLKWTKN